MKLVICTQDYENYGDDVNQHWKPKGGSYYIAAHITHNDIVKMGQKGLLNIVNKATEKMCNNECFREYIIDWELLEDDQLTRDEMLQLEYDGEITWPAKDISKEINNV